MRIFLLNIGFIELEDGSYYNNEVQLHVTVVDETHVLVPTPKGDITATIAELEDAIVSGGFGEF